MAEQEISYDAIVRAEVDAQVRHMPWWYSGWRDELFNFDKPRLICLNSRVAFSGGFDLRLQFIEGLPKSLKLGVFFLCELSCLRINLPVAVFGDTVKLAAWLEGVAEPRGIGVLRSIRDHVVKQRKLKFEDAGFQHEPFKAVRFRDGLLRCDRRSLAHCVRREKRFRCLADTCAERVPHAVRLRQCVAWPEDGQPAQER
ncbi:hypothetical protein [Agrobacterium tumefaciens]|uniref:hypothetical protein n=1 Tax=Agrobacterium tumefaciens TaxID=358 RepID=UPI0015738B7F|nr:hypothetical protein [Agrobacterium tumefaciens]NSY51964.1 hypothetical protein [Agrobacterium tumefaciens]NTC81510.1 hypothetical protein [Agrobacterium tumefaciens]NTD11091.1 hypothetical protein [Agrobacterium tumefaciens]WCK16854.1 hypothetical protein G6L41_023805 [Agrobacterium tumefaciens]